MVPGQLLKKDEGNDAHTTRAEKSERAFPAREEHEEVQKDNQQEGQRDDPMYGKPTYERKFFDTHNTVKEHYKYQRGKECWRLHKT